MSAPRRPGGVNFTQPPILQMRIIESQREGCDDLNQGHHILYVTLTRKTREAHPDSFRFLLKWTFGKLPHAERSSASAKLAVVCIVFIVIIVTNHMHFIKAIRPEWKKERDPVRTQEAGNLSMGIVCYHLVLCNLAKARPSLSLSFLSSEMNMRIF